VCNNTCTSNSTGQNCGTCGDVCGPASTCAASATAPGGFSCQCATGSGETYCGGIRGCVNEQTDNNNCGGCGNKCPAGATCSAGVCGCPTGDIDCGALIGCVNPANNPNHCGSCGHQCAAGDTCTSGVCTCPTGDVTCGTQCTNVSTDPAHCGNCTNACEQGDVCTTGVCSCPTGGVMCAGAPGALNVCTDTVEDPENCGACGTVCSAAQACLTSKCACRPGLTACGAAGTCTDLLHDPLNCGACGTTCGAGGFTGRCIDGVCQSSGVGGACPANRTNCGGGCYTPQQLAASPLHCSNQPGVCGTACATNQVCAQGTCVDFFTSTACTTCPCPACGTGTTCCRYPGTTESVCVAGSTCPG
jgi:hypothetical protein